MLIQKQPQQVQNQSTPGPSRTPSLRVGLQRCGLIQDDPLPALGVGGLGPLLLLQVGLLVAGEAGRVHEGLVAGGAGVRLGLGGESRLHMQLLLVLLQLAPPATIRRPVGLLMSCQAGGVGEMFPALAAVVASGSSPFSSATRPLFVFRDGGAPFAGPAPPTAAVLLAQGVEVGLVTGAELEADLEVGRGLRQVLLAGRVVVQQLLDVGHLMFGEQRGRPEAHVALRAGVELVSAVTLDDGARNVLRLLPFALLDFAAGLQGVVHDGHVGAKASIFREAFSFLVDEAMARQAGAVVELLPTDVAGVNATLAVEP